MKKEESERIVLEVIRRLTAAKPDAIPANGTLAIEDRVVTLATIESRLDGVRQVVVQPRAVVTPSVHDELRSNNIQLVRQARPTANPTNSRLIVANTSTTLTEELIDDLPCDVTALGPTSTLEATILNMIGLLENNVLGVVFTEQPEAAVCLANRHHHVCAFFGHSNESIDRGATTMAANLLVLEPSSDPLSAKDMLRRFLSIAPGRAE